MPSLSEIEPIRSIRGLFLSTYDTFRWTGKKYHEERRHFGDKCVAADDNCVILPGLDQGVCEGKKGKNSDVIASYNTTYSVVVQFACCPGHNDVWLI